MDISTIRRSGADRSTEDRAAAIPAEGTASARFDAMTRRALESEESAVVRERLGERMVDLTEEYFPAEVAERRRKIAGVAFGAGVIVGAVGGALLRR
jgi:hypothetical protein